MNLSTALSFAFLGIIWGTNFIFMRWASELITPIQIVFLRVLFGFIPIICIACWYKVFDRSHLRFLCHFTVMALLATVIYYWAFASGTSLLMSGISGVLSGCIPLFAFLMAALFLKDEEINAKRLMGVILGFIGVVIIARPWAVAGQGVSLAGVGYMILGSISVGGSFVYAKKYLANVNIRPLALTSYQIGIALLILTLITPFDGMGALFSDSASALGLVFGLGLLGTGVAYLTYYYLILKLGAITASSVTYVPPVVALIVGYLFANESIGYPEIFSMLLISMGVFLLQHRVKAKQR